MNKKYFFSVTKSKKFWKSIFAFSAESEAGSKRCKLGIK